MLNNLGEKPIKHVSVLHEGWVRWVKFSIMSTETLNPVRYIVNFYDVEHLSSKQSHNEFYYILFNVRIRFHPVTVILHNTRRLRFI